MLVVRYAHNDLRDNGHAYNTDIMSLTADITVGDAAPVKVTFKNTWSSEETFGNATAWAPNIDRIELGRLVDRP